MNVTLKRLENCQFEGTNATGNKVAIDGPPALGGKEAGVRPMEMVLMGLASCSAMDIIHILNKSRKTLLDLEVQVQSKRAETVPAVFTEIHLIFVASGDFSLEKLQKTVDLSVEKYCSVAHMLQNSVKITWECQIKPPA